MAGGLLLLMPCTLAAQRADAGIAAAYSSGFDMCLEALRTHDISDYTIQQRRENELLAAYAARRVDETELLVVLWNNARVEWDSTEIVSCEIRMRGLLDDLSVSIAVGTWARTMQAALATFQGVEELAPRSRVIEPDFDAALRRFAWCEADDLPFIATVGRRWPSHPIVVEITTIPSFDDPNPCEQE